MKVIKYIIIALFPLLLGAASVEEATIQVQQDNTAVPLPEEGNLAPGVNNAFYAFLSPQRHDFSRNGGQTYFTVNTNGRIAGFHNSNRVNFEVTSPAADMSLIKIVCTSNPGQYSTLITVTVINFEGEPVLLEFPVTQGY